MYVPALTEMYILCLHVWIRLSGVCAKDVCINSIKSTNEYDELEIEGIRAMWKDMLAFYTVLKTTDEINPQLMVYINEENKDELEELFWEMNTISYKIETIEEIETQVVLDEAGYPIIVDITTEITTLYINISSKTAENMADDYGFNDYQIEFLNELLLPENNSLWTAVLYEINSSDEQMVAVALSDEELIFNAMIGNHLVLVTCYPFRYSGSAPKKYVIYCMYSLE